MSPHTCTQCRDVPVRGVLSVIGCLLIFICFGAQLTFGNMNPYMTSYLRNRSALSPEVDYGDTTWVLTGMIVSASFFMPILCLLEQVIPSRICILLGAVIFIAALVVTYFSINYSFVAVIFSYGVLFSMGRALAYPVSIRLLFRWFPKHKGILSGLMSAAQSGSAFVYSQIETLFINPNNLSPDQNINNNWFFTQASLLDHVPYCYLLLAGIAAVVSLTGVLLISEPGPERTDETEKDDKKVENNATSIPDQKVLPPESTDIKSEAETSISPKEALRSARFYIAFMMYFFVGFGIDIFGALYKAYGQTFIHDDYFLSLVASFASVSSCVGNLIWGFLADRYTYKPVLMMIVCIFGTFLSTFIATEFGGRAMYFIWVCAMNFSFSGIFVLLPLITMDMFGSQYYSVNYGLVHSAGIAYSLISALFTSQLKEVVGWHGVFLVAGGVATIGFFLTIVLYIKKWNR